MFFKYVFADSSLASGRNRLCQLILKITDSSTSKEVDKIQFEILSYSHGLAMSLTSEGPSYRPVYQDYTIANYLDLHSSYLLERCARRDDFGSGANLLLRTI
ncbi:PF05638 family protein [Leptospira santarosai]|uniref:PF05638 family protein n=1 Tax=Leptospira santarosai TaxID=28183 RepID=A0A2P1QQ72_9LEPT|nr:PF05638 family protein [Leptospira santarosai]